MEDLVADVIREIKELADEAKREWDADRTDNYHYGGVLAFNEALCIIRDEFVGHEEIEGLLDFDIDKRYGAG